MLNSSPDVSICLSVSISHINILYTVVDLVGSSPDAVVKTLQESFQGIQLSLLLAWSLTPARLTLNTPPNNRLIKHVQSIIEVFSIKECSHLTEVTCC